MSKSEMSKFKKVQNPNALSDKEGAVLSYIASQIEANGYPPSVREICAAIGLKSTSTGHAYLKKLEEKGKITRKGLKMRAIKVVTNSKPKKVSTTIIQDTNNISIPLVGNVAAGNPIFAEENIEEYYSISTSLLKKTDGATYMLKVKGDSMINVGIYDGDYVIISKCDTAENGQIIVALIDNEATVKTFYKEKDYIRLQPENDSMAPIISKEAKIVGKVIGLYRKM